MTDTALPVLIRADDPDRQSERDATHGEVDWRVLVDGKDGPTSGLVQSVAIFEAGGYENAHSHDRPQTGHVLSGRGKAVVAGKEHEIAAGDTLFIPAGTVHAWSAPDAAMQVLVTFPADRLDDVATSFDGG